MPALRIQESQANYLRTAKLEDIGTDKGSLPDVKLSHIEQALVDLAIVFKVAAEKGLDVKNAIDTGQLADSIQFEQVKYLGGVYSIDISVYDYYKWVNKGVKGVNTNSKVNSPYSFRNLGVSTAFRLAIKHWIIRHGLKAMVKETRLKKHRLGTERKKLDFKTRDEANSLAYAVAVSIKKRGLKPTGFWDNAESATTKEVEKTLGNAFAIAIVNEIVK